MVNVGNEPIAAVGVMAQLFRYPSSLDPQWCAVRYFLSIEGDATVTLSGN